MASPVGAPWHGGSERCANCSINFANTLFGDFGDCGFGWKLGC